MKIIKPENLQVKDFQLYQMLDAFDIVGEKRKVTMGKAIMKPGVRVPEEGMNPHDSDEYSYIIKGSLTAGTEEVTSKLSAGDFSFIPQGTPHWCTNEGDEDCELIWLLVGDK